MHMANPAHRNSCCFAHLLKQRIHEGKASNGRLVGRLGTLDHRRRPAAGRRAVRVCMHGPFLIARSAGRLGRGITRARMATAAEVPCGAQAK